MPTITLYRLIDADLSNSSIQQILSSTHQHQEIRLREGVAARLFKSTVTGVAPDWAAYLSQITKRPFKLPARESVGAVLLILPNKKTRTIYAATWGQGHHLINSSKVDVQAGIRCAFNLISEKSPIGAEVPRVRALRSKKMGQNTLIVAAQASARANIDVFPFSVTSDQLRALTGRPTDTKKWGQTVTGGISIHVKRPTSNRLVQLCRDLEKAYEATDYQREYGWIDNLTPVSDRSKLAQAYQWAIGELKKPETSSLNISPPDLVDWDKVDSFEYRFGKFKERDVEPSALSLSKFLKTNQLLNSVGIEDLHDKLRLQALDGSAVPISWPIARCMTGEFELAGKVYVFDDRALFEVNNEYLTKLNKYMQAVPKTNVKMPKSTISAGKHEVEAEYNKRSAQLLPNAILLDKRNVTRRQATSVEVCDVALRDGSLIHVKRGMSPSSLSHLFSQGVVSAELLCLDEDFRAAIKKELSKSDIDGSGAAKIGEFKWLYENKTRSEDCEVIYVILAETKSVRPVTELPFFSRVNLRMRCEELRRMGYRHSIGIIPLK